MKQQMRREENVWSLPGNWDRRRQWRWNFCAGLVVLCFAICVLCFAIRFSFVYVPLLLSYLLIRLSFAFPSVLSTLLPFLSLMLSPSLFFLLFLSASPFFFLFFYKAREGFVLVGRLDNSREPCPVIETISAFNDETSSFILLLKPLLRRRWWTVVHETSLFLQFKWPFWFRPCGFTICNQTPG